MKNHTMTDLQKYLCLVVCIGSMQFFTNFVFEHMPAGYALSLFQRISAETVSLLLKWLKPFAESAIDKK